ncbi:hypothetical protein MHBO_001459 [Bonamia ostreae]|uniref:Nudix hydrolase domain-containing protein n=1 Tax=Bonamia ostreae TaxID=126728 RepID=A0ABV2AJ27_9EUKA
MAFIRKTLHCKKYFSKIENIEIKNCKKSNFFKPKTLFYRQNGIDKKWDFLECHESVSVLLYHLERKSFLVVKQFRPPVFASYSRKNKIDKNSNNYKFGCTYELVAGLIDKNKNLEEIVSEEVEEEVGYKISPDSLKLITGYTGNVGITGKKKIFKDVLWGN